MATTLATTRTAVLTALSGITTANKYRRRQKNYQFPCVVVGWPQEYDARPIHGDARDFTLDILVGVEVGVDDDSADDLLSTLLDATVAALLAGSVAWDVQPVTDFGETQTADDRIEIWCRIPLKVMT